MQLKHSTSLGNLHTTKSGYPFHFFGSEWRLDGSTVINFKYLADIDKDTALSFRRALCRYAEELSAMHTYNMFHHFNAYIKATNEGKVTLQSLTNYRASFDSETEYKLGALKGRATARMCNF